MCVSRLSAGTRINQAGARPVNEINNGRCSIHQSMSQPRVRVLTRKAIQRTTEFHLVNFHGCGFDSWRNIADIFLFFPMYKSCY